MSDLNKQAYFGHCPNCGTQLGFGHLPEICRAQSPSTPAQEAKLPELRKYKDDFLHSDYGDNSYYLVSPTGIRVWLSSQQLGAKKAFVNEMNTILERERQLQQQLSQSVKLVVLVMLALGQTQVVIDPAKLENPEDYAVNQDTDANGILTVSLQKQKAEG